METYQRPKIVDKNEEVDRILGPRLIGPVPFVVKKLLGDDVVRLENMRQLTSRKHFGE